MATAMIYGLLAQGSDKNRIMIAEPWHVNRQKLADLGVCTTTNNVEAANFGDIVILAIKAQNIKAICQELAWASFTSRSTLPLIVSIAPGVTTGTLEQWCQTKDWRSPPIVRAMPNTPALVGEGATGVYARPNVPLSLKELLNTVLQSLGSIIEWVEHEALLDVVMGISGCGPAYFYLMVEHLIASGTRLGLPDEQATRLAVQTCLGAGRMLAEREDSPTQLRVNVTSPGGTTQAAVERFEQERFGKIVDGAVQAAIERGDELRRSLGA